MAKPASSRTSKSASGPASSPGPDHNRERPGEPKSYEASRDELLEFYRQMLLIRRFEERAGQLYGLGFIGGFCHLYIGQEAVAVRHPVGADARQGQRDHRLSGPWPHAGLWHRSQDHHGRTDRPRGGHFARARAARCTCSASSINSTAATASSARRSRSAPASPSVINIRKMAVSASPISAMARANQGQVYESFNMASLWNLPIIYVIENKQYAMGTSVHRSSAEDRFYLRGESFRIPGIRWMAWMCLPAAARPRKRWPGFAPAKGRSSWR